MGNDMQHRSHPDIFFKASVLAKIKPFKPDPLLTELERVLSQPDSFATLLLSFTAGSTVQHLLQRRIKKQLCVNVKTYYKLDSNSEFRYKNRFFKL